MHGFFDYTEKYTLKSSKIYMPARIAAEAERRIQEAAGGGGIPVLEQGTTLKGASAIIEKDYTAAKLADQLDASTLLFLTETNHLHINQGTDKEEPIKRITAEEALALTRADHFDPITTQPKMEASISFVTSAPERRAIITHVDNALEAVKGKTGTIIRS